eukprot:m.61854 g.61854  ORF g.61854 m.61854 type:complete len:74 (+) comp35023_c0_seq2:899-1120(+)
MVPSHADFLFSFSSFEGYTSIRNTIDGFWYVEELGKTFHSHAEQLHLLDLLTRVHRKELLQIAASKCQLSSTH